VIKIFKMNPTSGKYTQVSKEGGWLSSCMNSPFLHNGKFLIADGLKGNLYEWNPEDGSFSTIGSGDWRTTGCFVNYYGRLFAFCSAVYELNTSTGKYAQISTGYGSWSGTERCVIRGEYIYCFVKVTQDKVKYANIWRFNPSDGSSVKVGSDDWYSCGTIL